MSKQGISVFSLAVIASGALTAHRAITSVGAHGATDIYGVTKNSALAAGDVVNADVCGSTAIEAGAAIALGTKYVVADAQGRAILGGTAAACLGRLVPGQSATAAGEYVEVVLSISI